MILNCHSPIEKNKNKKRTDKQIETVLHRKCPNIDIPLPHYRALKLTYPCHIGGLSHVYNIKTEICQGSVGETVGIFNPTMFKPVYQP